MKHPFVRVAIVLCAALLAPSAFCGAESQLTEDATPRAALPSEVRNALKILLASRPYTDPAAANRAAATLHAYETSVVQSEATLRNEKTGALSKRVTHRFLKLGVDVTYDDGQVIGCSLIKKSP